MAEEKCPSTPKKEPTPQEAMFFFAIVKHTRTKSDINWDAVAAEQNLKSAEVAKVRFGQIKRKLGISSTTETPASSARASGKKREALSGTPTKVAKATGRAGAKGRGRGKAKPQPVADDNSDLTDEAPIKDEPVAPEDQSPEDTAEDYCDPSSLFDDEMLIMGKREEI